MLSKTKKLQNQIEQLQNQERVQRRNKEPTSRLEEQQSMQKEEQQQIDQFQQKQEKDRNRDKKYDQNSRYEQHSMRRSKQEMENMNKTDTGMNISNMSQNKGQNYTYSFGEFSKYAVDKQRQGIEKQSQINAIIKEAIFSHLKQIQKYIKNEAKLEKQNEVNELKMRKHFPNANKNSTWSNVIQINSFIQNPIEYTIKQCLRKKQFNCEKIILQFIQRNIQCHDYLVVQGKIIKIQNLKKLEYTEKQGKISIPIQNNDLQISFKDSKVPFLEYFNGVDNVTKNTLLKMKDDERLKIIAMVSNFLKSKFIELPKQKIEQRILNLLHEQLSNIKQ